SSGIVPSAISKTGEIVSIVSPRATASRRLQAIVPQGIDVTTATSPAHRPGIGGGRAVLVSPGRRVPAKSGARETTMRNAKAPIAKRIAIIVASAVAIAVGPVWSTFHTFQIHELYSSPAGSVKFVELHEPPGANGQHLLAGHALTSTQGATTRTYIFPTDLPNSSTAGKRVLIATPGFAGLGIVTPDYIIPAPFLFPGGGTL